MSRSTAFPYPLYLVISESFCQGRDLLDVAEQAILGGVDLIQLREKDDTVTDFLRKAKLLKELTDAYGIPLLINDNLFVAQAVDAAGIHVGQRDVDPIAISKQWNEASKLIGYSLEAKEQLQSPNIAFADYLGISPVFSTATKTDTLIEWGLGGIAWIRERTEKPLVAIGNMNKKHAKAVIEAGADCIAVVSAICGAPNPQKAAYELKNELLK